MTTPALVFITQTGPARSRNAQTQIRKHVMRDIGKLRRKAGHRDKVSSFQFTLEVPDDIDIFNNSTRSIESGEACSSALQVEAADNIHISNSLLHLDNESALLSNPSELSSAVPAIDRVWTGRMDPFAKYPIEMNHRTRQLMDHVFDDRYGNTPPFRDAWMPIGMMDPAAFHQVLSNAALNLASLRAGRSVPENLESIRHHAKAVKLVTQRIANPKEAVADGLLGAVAGFSCYHHAIGNQAGWHLHMSGIKEILRLRGGIQSLDSNHFVRIILFWVDVGGAATEDIPPYFPVPLKCLPVLPQAAKDTPLSSRAQSISDTWRRLLPCQFEIMDIMNGLQRFNAYFNSQILLTDGAIFRDGGFAASFILPLQHRLLLLSAHAIDVEEPVSSMVQAVRLACILYLAEIRRSFGVMGVVSTLQSRKLKPFLEMSGEWEELGLLRTWCLAMGGMESQGPLRVWFVEELKKATDSFGMESWEEAEGQLREVLWFDDVHSPVFRELHTGEEKSRGGRRRRGY